LVTRRLAECHGWQKLADRPMNVRRNIAAATIWDAWLPGLTVGCYDDPLAEASCVIVRSCRALSEVEGIEGVLKMHLPFLEDDEILSLPETSSSTSHRALSVIRLGFGAPLTFDQRFADRISEATGDINAKIRTAALWAITYTEWPEFRPLLSRVAEYDQKRLVKELASQVISVFDRLGMS